MLNVDDEKQHHEGFQPVDRECGADRQPHCLADGWYSFQLRITLVMPYRILFYKFSNSLFWGIGAGAGMASWFCILVNVIKVYQKSIKITTVVWVINYFGSILILIGIFSLFTILWKLVFSVCSFIRFVPHEGKMCRLWKRRYGGVLDMQARILLFTQLSETRLGQTQTGLQQVANGLLES